jgi:LytR cell envelope-related transcriptional attenuator
VVLAFSIHTFVDKIGAYAGFAAALGLALFALLLFAQARELRRLREWGAEAHARLEEQERRLAAALELARRAGASARQATSAGATSRSGAVPLSRPAQPAPAGARPRQAVAPASTSSPVRLPLLPAAPAGVGGPALASATAMIPLPAHPPESEAADDAAAPATAIEAAAATAQAPAPATVAAQSPAGTPAPVAAPGGATIATEQATVIAPPPSGNGHHEAPPALPARETPTPAAAASASRPAAPRPSARPVGGPAGAGPTRTPAAAPLRARSVSATPRGRAAQPSPHARRRTLALLGGLGVLLVVVIIVIVAGNSGGGGHPSVSTPAHVSSAGPSSGTTSAAHTNAAPAPPHGGIVVAVLNGTAVPGLASTIASKLATAGFARGQVGNAADQQRSVTVVSYTGGHEAAAMEVAKALGVPSDAVQPIDAATQASACPQGAASCTATVVVTVGADRQR